MDCADSLREICVDDRITESVAIGLRRQAELLKRWKEEVGLGAPESSRVKSLQKVTEFADKLKNAIEALDFHDRMALDNEFFNLNDLLSGRALAHELDLGSIVVPQITIAASRAIERIQNNEKSGRDRRVADLIRCIASELKPAGIVPAHHGFFREICEAVFEAAGLPYPDKAHRYFMEHIRPECKAKGYCL